jgi:predicted RNA methylase
MAHGAVLEAEPCRMEFRDSAPLWCPRRTSASRTDSMTHSPDTAPNDLLRMDLAAGAVDWTPTPHGKFLAQVMAGHNLVQGLDVLELGAGVGIHTVVISRKGAKSIVATEIAEELLETTRVNVARNVLDTSNIDYRVADWLDTPGAFDVIVSNPPFCKSGRQNRRYFLDSLILDGHKRLRPGGRLIFVQSSMADIAMTQSRLEQNGYAVEILDTQEGEFRDYYFEDKTFMDEIQRVPNGFEERDGKLYETLFVITAVLQPFTPPDGAHLPGQ